MTVCDCGNKPVDEDSRFCHICGRPFDENDRPPEKAAWDRTIEEIPCIQIEASDWLQKESVLQWIKDNDVATWESIGDVFTIYDHDEGPDCPETDGKMPWWLWNTIKKIVKERNIAYCIVRLMNVEPTKTSKPEDPVMPLLNMIIEDLGAEPEAGMKTEKGTFSKLIIKIVNEAERLKGTISRRENEPQRHREDLQAPRRRSRDRDRTGR